MDLEAAKKATVDSMEVQWKSKEWLTPCRWKWRSRNAKETIIVNQPGNNDNHDNHHRKVERHGKGAVIGAGVGAATGAIISKKSTGSYNRWCGWSRVGLEPVPLYEVKLKEIFFDLRVFKFSWNLNTLLFKLLRFLNKK
jgi:hypothetical protein